MGSTTVNDFSGLYNIRDYKESDRALIKSTFLKGLYYGDSWFSQIDKPAFMENYKLVVDSLIGRCAVKIACLPDDEDVILGYSILSSDYQAIVWVYVKEKWRKKGLAKKLCPKHPAAVTHLTSVGKTLLQKLNGTKFDPFFKI